MLWAWRRSRPPGRITWATRFICGPRRSHLYCAGPCWCLALSAVAHAGQNASSGEHKLPSISPQANLGRRWEGRAFWPCSGPWFLKSQPRVRPAGACPHDRPAGCPLQPARRPERPGTAWQCPRYAVFVLWSRVANASRSCFQPRSASDSLPQPRFAEAPLCCDPARPSLLQAARRPLGPSPAGWGALRPGAPLPLISCAVTDTPAVIQAQELLLPLGSCPWVPPLPGTW